MSTNDETHTNIDPVSGTNPKFWDCECDENYIHAKAEKTHCPICHTYEEDQPDSMKAEVQLLIGGK